MLKTYCFEVHVFAISSPFAEVLRERETECFHVPYLAWRSQISGDILSLMRSTRTSKMFLFSASDLKLVIVNFEYISNLFLMFLLLTLNK